MCMGHTVWKVSKYGVISGPYFPVFGPEITTYLDTFHAVCVIQTVFKLPFAWEKLVHFQAVQIRPFFHWSKE